MVEKLPRARTVSETHAMHDRRSAEPIVTASIDGPLVTATVAPHRVWSKVGWQTYLVADLSSVWSIMMVRPIRERYRTERTTMSAIVRATAGEIATVTEKVAHYVRASRSDSTWRAYSSDREQYLLFCRESGVSDPLPASPETVAAYLTWEHDRGRRPSTLDRRLAALSVWHKALGHPSPTGAEIVRTTLAGIRRESGTAQDYSRPVRIDDLRRMVAALGDSDLDLRDRAILLLGYAGAMRRSEVAALDVDDLERVSEGLRLTVRRSKTDQEGAGLVKGIPCGSREETCPVRAVERYMDRLGIVTGPLFLAFDPAGRATGQRLSGRGVARTVKRLASLAGIDPSEVSGHSLRSGLVTDCYSAGVAESDIMRQTGHRSPYMSRRYRHEGELFSRNPAASVGL